MSSSTHRRGSSACHNARSSHPPTRPQNRLGELAEPYWVLKDGGYDITIASPAGGAVPIDEASLQGDFKTPECDRMMADGEAAAAAQAHSASCFVPCQHLRTGTPTVCPRRARLRIAPADNSPLPTTPHTNTSTTNTQTRPSWCCSRQ